MKTKILITFLIVCSLNLNVCLAEVLENKAEKQGDDVAMPENMMLADDEDVVYDEAAEYSYGTVESIKPDEIVIKEYDYDTGQDIQVAYKISANVKLDGVLKTSDILKGDNIEIDFKDEDNLKTAFRLSVEKPISEEEKQKVLEEAFEEPTDR